MSAARQFSALGSSLWAGGCEPADGVISLLHPPGMGCPEVGCLAELPGLTDRDRTGELRRCGRQGMDVIGVIPRSGSIAVLCSSSPGPVKPAYAATAPLRQPFSGRSRNTHQVMRTRAERPVSCSIQLCMCGLCRDILPAKQAQTGESVVALGGRGSRAAASAAIPIAPVVELSDAKPRWRILV